MDDELYSSDTSDDDYVPTGADAADDSPLSDANEEGESLSEDGEDDDGSKKKKSKKKRGKKKKKVEGTNEQDSLPSEEPKSQEDQKARVDSLWADFKKDTSVPLKPKTESSESKPVAATLSAKPVPEPAKKDVVLEFAGEIVRPEENSADKPTSDSSQPAVQPSASAGAAVKRPMLARPGGLASIASQLQGKKQKLSTLEKTKMDWDRFKQAEGISEELKNFNQGKQGYLERQDFLQRTDLRQFEIEKNLRQTRRKN